MVSLRLPTAMMAAFRLNHQKASVPIGFGSARLRIVRRCSHATLCAVGPIARLVFSSRRVNSIMVLVDVDGMRQASKSTAGRNEMKASPMVDSVGVHVSRKVSTTKAIVERLVEESPDNRLASLVRFASRGLARAMQLRLSRYEVSFGHWLFLRFLWDREGKTQHELSVLAGVMEPTTHTAIKNMEQLGYVERRREDGNRKNHYIHLTDQGRALQSILVPLADEAYEIALRGVSPDDLQATRRTLATMIRNLALDELQLIDDGVRATSTRQLGANSRRASRTGTDAVSKQRKSASRKG